MQQASKTFGEMFAHLYASYALVRRHAAVAGPVDGDTGRGAFGQQRVNMVVQGGDAKSDLRGGLAQHLSGCGPWSLPQAHCTTPGPGTAAVRMGPNGPLANGRFSPCSVSFEDQVLHFIPGYNGIHALYHARQIREELRGRT